MRGALAAALFVAACNADVPRGGKAADAPIAPPAVDAGDADGLRVTDPGAEPRLVRRYAFASGQPERRVLTIQQSMTGAERALSFSLGVDANVRGTKLELKLASVHMEDARPEVEQELARAIGTIGVADVSPRGELGDLELTPTVLHSEVAADVVTEGMRQLAELLVLRLPDVPVGAGATWEMRHESNRDGIRAVQTTRYQLARVDGGGGTVSSAVSIELPKTPLPERKDRPRGTIAVSASGAYIWELRWAGVATHVEGSMTTTQTLELEGQPPQVQAVTSKHSIASRRADATESP